MKSLIRAILISGFVIITVYTFLILITSSMYERILFHETKLNDNEVKKITERHPEADYLQFNTEDAELNGWIIHKNSEKAIIYFGGNAEEVSWMLNHHKKLGNSSLILVNYRGFGNSTGKPYIDSILNDSLLVYDEINKKYSYNTINLVGRSIGTGFATHVADKREVRKVVLVSPFTTLSDIVSESIVLKPASLFIKNRFGMEEKAERMETELLMLTAEEDQIIPEKLSEEFYRNWNGKKERKCIRNKGHNNIHNSDEFWINIKEFLD